MSHDDAPDDDSPDGDARSADAADGDARSADAADGDSLDAPDGEADLTDIHFVGPATAEVLRAADFDGTAIPEKAVSYEMLVDAGVNHGVAERIRKEHSLPWTLGGDEDSLDERSEKVRGLRDGERAWVAASSGDWESADVGGSDDADARDDGRSGDWTPSASTDEGTAGESAGAGGGAEASTDGSGAAEAAEAAWRERSRPDPVTDVPGVDGAAADLLADAGITSIRSLATADPERVAASLGLDPERVAGWRDAARDFA